MKDLLIALLMLSGAFLMLSASVGLLRMPDLFTRMQTATKAFTLGPLLILSGTVLKFAALDVAAKVLLVILFLYITAPIAGHLVGRAAYKRGVPRWSGTIYDEIGSALDLPPESPKVSKKEGCGDPPAH
jgi:multicomponent Na+:H+ antiporter subunit G